MFFMRYSKSLISALLFFGYFCFGEALANEPTPWEITIAGGTAELDAQDFTTHIYPTLIPGDKNQQQNAEDWKAWTVQAGVGYRFYLWETKRYSDEIQWLPLLVPQINFYYLKGNVDGTVNKYYEYPEIDPNCDVDYSVGVSSSRLMADVNLTFISWRNYALYGKAGIGPSWNQVDYHAKEGPSSQELSLNQQTDTNFAYEFGGGARVAITKQLDLSLEYLYSGFTHLELNNHGTLEGAGDLNDIENESFNLSSQAVLLGVNVTF
jgi:opacity protein-like surface antigen